METTVSNDVQDQTYNEESMLRPTSLANVSELNDPSTDKSKMSHQIWTEYRGGRGIETPENGEEDVEDDQETTPRIKELSANKSMASRFYEKMGYKNNPKVFSTLGDLQDRFDKANKENLNLKIRIHLLEQDQGLLEKTDQENIYRINLDLKVENEMLKQEVLDKDELLKEAFLAVEQQEEKEKETEELKTQLQQERHDRMELQTLLDSQGAGHQNEHLVRQSLLGEAFGSINLGSGLEDKNQDAANDDHASDDLREEISRLGTELELKNSEKHELETILNEKQNMIFELQRNVVEVEHSMQDNLASKDELFKVLNTQYLTAKDRVLLLEDELATQNSVKDELECLANELRNQNQSLINQLTMEQNSAQILKERQDDEVNQLNDELANLKKALLEETSSTKDQETYLNLKLTEIANLHKDIDSLKIEIKKKDEDLQKMETGLDALAQVSEEQNANRIEISKELKKKNLMYDRLVTEYETAKAKVRKYRSERGSRSSLSSTKSGGSQFDQDHARASYYIKQGAEKALSKANEVYNEHVKIIDQNHQQAMMAMRKRLEELAICLEQILNNGLLDISVSVRETLQMSLNESRRLSRSVLETSNLNTTLDGIESLMPVTKPYIEVKLEDLEVEINADLDNVVNEVKAKHEEQVQDLIMSYDEKIKLLNCQIENLSGKTEKMENLEQELADTMENVKLLQSEQAELSFRYTKMMEEFNILEEENMKLKQKATAIENLDKLQQDNDDLRKQLDEALDKIRDNKKRQEDIDKVLRHQLAKTHSVLKRTKNAMNTIDNNKENIE